MKTSIDELALEAIVRYGFTETFKIANQFPNRNTVFSIIPSVCGYLEFAKITKYVQSEDGTIERINR